MEKPPQSFQLILSDRDGLGRLTVDLESFFEFSFSLADELQELLIRFGKGPGLHEEFRNSPA